MKNGTAGLMRRSPAVLLPAPRITRRPVVPEFIRIHPTQQVANGGWIVMADPWELILHHTYAGTPGTACDLSPARSHGDRHGDVSFLKDGASADSGAIRVGNEDSGVRVACGKEWAELGALRGEVRFRQDYTYADPSFFQTLIATPSFDFMTYAPSYAPARHIRIRLRPHSALQFSLIRGEGVPFGQWLTWGFVYDGRSTVQLTLNGQVVKSASGVFTSLPSGSGTDLDIGNTLPGAYVGGYLLDGLIDEVKIWRRNPHRMGSDFLGRPMDDDVAACWATWGRAIATWLRENPQCADPLSGLLSLLDQALDTVTSGADPVLAARFESAVGQYRTLWSAGHVNDPAMVAVLLEIYGVLRQAGIEPEYSIEEIVNSECWRRLFAEVPPPDCDGELVALVNETARQLGERQRNVRRPAAE
ncbi:LamG-like jellyroll fold domain-containing protein [Streptomyces sp. NPDC001581]|uniref:LamG-like jellyroll fold domain-containing protein n=1 Tax=Streptomyces sp. NPDC001581 TaxID=3154386 RepID=UPI003322C861